jgi:hypothetical protein
VRFAISRTASFPAAATHSIRSLIYWLACLHKRRLLLLLLQRRLKINKS